MSQADFPDSPFNGDEFSYNGLFYIYQDGAWSRKTPAESVVTGPMFSGKGSLLSASASGSPVGLPADVTNGYGLKAQNSETTGTMWSDMPAETAYELDDIGDVSASSPSAGNVLRWTGSGWEASSSIYAGVLSQNTVTTDYTIAGSDMGGLLVVNSASAVTITIPTNSATPINTGRYMNILQAGAGQVTVAGAGVTVNGRTKLRTQHSLGTLVKRGTDTWVFMGDTVD